MARPGPGAGPERSAFAFREVGAVAAVLGLTLLAFSGRYGYHRDELYFLQAGHHLDWGYPDQPPLVPLLARLADLVAPDSLVVLRLPSTLAAAGVVLLAGLIAHELGARRSGQVLAAVSTALCGFVLATGHLLSTATFALLGGTAITFLLLRMLHGRGERPRTWVLLGVLAGITAEFNILALALVAAVGVAVLLVGPRSWFRRPGPYLAVALALAAAAPYLIWQADHGWPQADIGRAIAEGGSGSSESRASFLPMVFLQVGPWLAPLWLVGLVRLLRSSTVRCLAVAFLVLAAVVLVAGGKPYYVSGFLPLLLAAGAQPLLDRARVWVAPLLLVASLPVLVFVLPTLPAEDAGVAVDVNYDAGETIGWPEYVDQIADAYRGLPAGTRILTGNYGEAGAVFRFGPARGLPDAYSGHNGFGRWGPPPGSVPVLAVGVDRKLLDGICTSVEDLGRLREVHGIDNDEDGTSLSLCTAPIVPWSELWSRIAFVG